MLTDNIVINILKGFYPEITFVAGHTDGVHPKTVFGIVTEISQKSIGTRRKEHRSSTGQWFYAQPKEYTISIGFQGKRDTNAYELAEQLQFFLNTTKYKAEFRQRGYAVRVDHGSLTTISMKMDTDTFLRHVFNVYLTTDQYTFIKNNSINSVELNGVITDTQDNVLEDYNETVSDKD